MSGITPDLWLNLLDRVACLEIKVDSLERRIKALEKNVGYVDPTPTREG